MKTIEDVQVEIIDKDVNEASQIARESGFRIRVMKRDGIGMRGTMDFRKDRINVETSSDVVTDILSIG